MSYLSHDNRETDSNLDASDLQHRDKDTHGSAQTGSRIFEDWLNNYRHRLAEAFRRERAEKGMIGTNVNEAPKDAE